MLNERQKKVKMKVGIHTDAFKYPEWQVPAFHRDEVLDPGFLGCRTEIVLLERCLHHGIQRPANLSTTKSLDHGVSLAASLEWAGPVDLDPYLALMLSDESTSNIWGEGLVAYEELNELDRNWIWCRIQGLAKRSRDFAPYLVWRE